jgi:antitoxin (DNA-binding transcriptional repressor) of toxin-antitoxin stability system
MKLIELPENETLLLRLIEDVRAGEEIILTQGQTPLARLVSIERFQPNQPKRQLGTAKGQVWMSDDFDATPNDFAEYL